MTTVIESHVGLSVTTAALYRGTTFNRAVTHEKENWGFLELH